MIADLALLRELAWGVAAVSELPSGIFFSRMTDHQLKFYEDRQDFGMKSLASAGVRLEFETDAESVSLEGFLMPGSSRRFAFFDIFVNGLMVQHEGSENFIEKPEFSFTIPLNGTINKVVIYFPNLSAAILNKLEFHGETKILPIEKKRKILCFGDSITQGYDAKFSSLSYPNQLADALNADMLNKAIGGETFQPGLLEEPDPFLPDLITVAYGTNDWSKLEKEELTENSRGFAELLVKHYPGVPVFGFLPIWRADHDRITGCGTFEEARRIVRQAYEAHPQIKVIDGLPFVPHVQECFSDQYLHPNDVGFQYMGKSIVDAIKPYFKD